MHESELAAIMCDVIFVYVYVYVCVYMTDIYVWI